MFAIDVQLPDMLNAAIAQCPVFGGRLVSFDAKAIEAMPGVRQVVAVGDNAVAVVPTGSTRPRRRSRSCRSCGTRAGMATWTGAGIAKLLAAGLDAPQAGVGLKQGDVAQAFVAAAKTVEATYSTPFLNHATLEPMNCTAQVRGDRGGGVGRRPRTGTPPWPRRRRPAGVKPLARTSR